MLVCHRQLCVGYACVLELRKLNGKRSVLRQSVRATDASLSSAVVLPLVKGQNGFWVAACDKARAQLVPVLSLGRRVVTQAVAGGTDGGLSIVPAPIAAGGPQLQATMLTPALFAAAAMVKVKQDLAKMKVSELKEELKVRKLTTTGAKPWLRRRLHAALLSGQF